MRCSAITRAGGRCRRPASAGQELCHAHSASTVGRPEKLSDEVRRRLVEAARAGATRELAAAYAGLSRSTLQRWLARAERGEERFRGLAEELRRAEAEAELHALATLRRAMPQDWRAAEAYLRLRQRERFGRQGTRHPGAREEDPTPGEVNIGAIIAHPRGRELVAELRARMDGARALKPGELRASD